MKQQKHHMGVEVPSFFEYQRRKAEQNAADTAAAAAAAAKAKKQGFFDAIFAPEPKPKAEQPAAPPAPGPSTVRPGFMRQPGTYVDATQWFEVAKIWERVGNMIAQYGHKDFVDALTAPIYHATRAERDFQAAADIAQFFGIPAAEFQGLTIEQSWQNVIGPFFEALEHSINRVKPFGIPGSISFELEPTTGQLLMAYRN